MVGVLHYLCVIYIWVPFCGSNTNLAIFKFLILFIPFLGIKQHADHTDTISAHLNGQYASANTQNNISTCVPSISQHLVIRDCLVVQIRVAILGAMMCAVEQNSCVWVAGITFVSSTLDLLANVWSRKPISNFSRVPKGTLRYFYIIPTLKI